MGSPWLKVALRYAGQGLVPLTVPPAFPWGTGFTTPVGQQIPCEGRDVPIWSHHMATEPKIMRKGQRGRDVPQRAAPCGSAEPSRPFLDGAPSSVRASLRQPKATEEG